MNKNLSELTSEVVVLSRSGAQLKINEHLKDYYKSPEDIHVRKEFALGFFKCLEWVTKSKEVILQQEKPPTDKYDTRI